MTSQRVLLKYDESETLNMKSNCSLFLKTVSTQLSKLNYFHAATSMMKTQMSISKPLVLIRDVLLMTPRVNSSLLRTESKKQIAPFLRSEGVL